MILSDTAIRRPIFALVINGLILMLGIAALLRMPVRQYPDVDPPVITVTTQWTGATASVVESEVTKRIEEALSGIEGLRSITSESFDGASAVEIEFTLDRRIEDAAADVRDQLGRIAAVLPDDADAPVLTKAASDNQPFMWITVQSEQRDALELTDLARRSLVDPLSVVPGVSRVIVGGERRYAMRAWIDHHALTLRNLTVVDVMRRLQEENIDIPTGRVDSQMREIVLQAPTRFTSVDDFRQLIIRESGDGASVRLGDIAEISVGAENYRTGLWINQQTSVGLGILRQSQSNTLDVSRGVQAVLQRITQSTPDDVNIFVAFDRSVYIESAQGEVLKTLLIAFSMVVLVILVFLRSFTATLVPTLAIPVSLLAACMVMLAFGFSLNVLTMLAIILAIGLVVDDGIVVLENIHRRMELGEPALLAAQRGTREVGFAVIATTLVLIATFAPLAFMTTNVGRLFNEFGLTLAATVAFSSLVALTLVPMLSSRLLTRQTGSNPVGRVITRGLSFLERTYRGILQWILRPWGAVAVISLALTISLGGHVLYERAQVDMIPSEDQGFLFCIIQAPEGSSLAYTREQIAEVEAQLEPLMGDDGPVDATIAIVAPAFRAGSTPSQAFLIIRLKPWADRDIAQQALQEQLFPQFFFGVPGANVITISPPSFPGVGFGQSVQVAVGGESYEEVEGWSQSLLAAVREEGILEQPRLDYDDTKPQLRLHIDRDRAADLGVSVADIGATLQMLLGGRTVTRYEDRSELYDVIMQLPDEQRANPEVIEQLYVRSGRNGGLVSLGNVVTYSYHGTMNKLKRVDRRPSIVLQGNPAPGWTVDSAVQRIDQLRDAVLPPTASLTYLGLSREAREGAAGLIVIFFIAVVVVYAVLAAQFESWIHPFVILSTLPLALTGAFAGLHITGTSVNIYAVIGIIMLIGLMAKNGILMVEFANQLRNRGRSVPDAMAEAAVLRLRPILMTSLATIIGAMPLALSSGAGAEGRNAIGYVVIGGMMVATAMTLLVIPVLYRLLAPFTAPSGTADRLLRVQERAHPDQRS
ncbi:MAG: efflux RND transporter permease subunit [Planctomycetota bacterium]|nr:MAG: efflux RND transporter permease subunit [Planctomycetota bacterium]